MDDAALDPDAFEDTPGGHVNGVDDRGLDDQRPSRAVNGSASPSSAASKRVRTPGGDPTPKRTRNRRNAELCETCKKIAKDFDKIFTAHVPHRNQGTPRRKIAPPSETSPCSLCRFFSQMKIDPHYDEGAVGEDLRSQSYGPQDWYLRAFSAQGLFGLSKDCSFSDTCLFAVVRGKWWWWEGSDAFREQMNRFILPTRWPAFGDEDRFFGRLVPARLDYDLVRSWMDTCDSMHKRICRTPRGSNKDLPKGFRVIDCETRRIVPAPEVCDYVALSYLWGKADGDQAPRLDDRLPGECPLVIEDAIVATNSLGFKFLWVDRFCINQDNAEEKHTQIANMDKVYSIASLTIVAAAGHDPSAGLPGVTTALRKPQPVFEMGSHQRLIFTEEQVYFQCLGMHCFESISMPTDPLHVRDGSTFREGIKRFRLYPNTGFAKAPINIVDRVNEYAGRRLSYESDRLNAVLGVLKEFEKLKPPIYHFWGLPLLHDIDMTEVKFSDWLWPTSAGNDNGVSPVGKYLDAATEYSLRIACGLIWDFRLPGHRRRNFPSWSWVGWSNWTDLTFDFINTRKSTKPNWIIESSFLFTKTDESAWTWRRRSKVPFAVQIQRRDGEFREWPRIEGSTFPSHFTHTPLLRITATVSPDLLFRRSRGKDSEWTIVPLIAGTGTRLMKFSLTREVDEDEISADGILLFYSLSGVAMYLLIEREGDYYVRLGMVTLLVELADLRDDLASVKGRPLPGAVRYEKRVTLLG
ncbi:hypothetical protein DL771_003286 [Monosporascus sp. 5C6A]|nr:hypothetical protein DL771_003286 [Monosporascus sp. 5C6A]